MASMRMYPSTWKKLTAPAKPHLHKDRSGSSTLKHCWETLFRNRGSTPPLPNPKILKLVSQKWYQSY
eukprot:810514-Amphidinium_carterae.1